MSFFGYFTFVSIQFFPNIYQIYGRNIWSAYLSSLFILYNTWHNVNAK